MGSRGSSVADYVLTSQDLFKYINPFEVHDPNMLSDHCLLTFSFCFEHDSVGNTTQYNYEQAPGRFKWTSDFKTDFLNVLGNIESTDKLNRLNTSIPSCTETYKLGQCLSDLSSVIEHAASLIFQNLSNKPKEAQPMYL